MQVGEDAALLLAQPVRCRAQLVELSRQRILLVRLLPERSTCALDGVAPLRAPLGVAAGVVVNDLLVEPLLVRLERFDQVIVLVDQLIQRALDTMKRYGGDGVRHLMQDRPLRIANGPVR